MAALQFLIRSTAKNPDKLSIIQCRLRDGNTDLFAPTGIKTHPAFWDEKKQNVIKPQKAHYANEVNRKLAEIKSHILTQFASLTGEPSKDWLRETIDRFNNPEKYESKPMNLFKYIESYLKSNPDTTKRGGYDRVLFFLKKYSEHTKRTIDFKDINLEFYEDFKDFLALEKKLSLNYIAKTLKILKIFLNAAQQDGYNQYSYYKTRRFKIEEEDADTTYLNDDEINKLYTLNLSNNKTWEQIRDVFIVGCWTGLRWSDWSKVSNKNIRDEFIVTEQQKTGGTVVIPLHEIVRAILLKYNGLLPEFSKEKINLEIKKIAAKAGINEKIQETKTKGGITRTITYKKYEKISTHSGRRSFATNYYKRGLNIQDIMDITGHQSKEAFLKYIRATEEEEIQQKMRRIRNFMDRPLMKIAK